jgi:hypothetical protein
MSEGISRLVATIHETQCAMIPDQGIAELLKLEQSIFRRVGRIHSMMKVNLKFSPASVTMLGQSAD